MERSQRSEAFPAAAVMLAAGQGVRLSAETIPKCLVQVSGRPVVHWIATALAEVGVPVLHVILGFRAEVLREELAAIDLPLEVSTVVCDDWALGNGRSAACAEAVVERGRSFLLMMSDHLVGAPHVATVAAAYVGPSGPCVLGTCPPGAAYDLDDATKVRVDEAGYIRAIGKQIPTYDAVDTGVFVFDHRIFDGLREAREAGDHSLTGGNRVLAERGDLAAVPVGERWWQDIDTPADLRRARRQAPRALGGLSPKRRRPAV